MLSLNMFLATSFSSSRSRDPFLFLQISSSREKACVQVYLLHFRTTPWGRKLQSFFPTAHPFQGMFSVHPVNQTIITSYFKCWGFSSEQDSVDALLVLKAENKQIYGIMPKNGEGQRGKKCDQGMVVETVCMQSQGSQERSLRDTCLSWESKLGVKHGEEHKEHVLGIKNKYKGFGGRTRHVKLMEQQGG